MTEALGIDQLVARLDSLVPKDGACSIVFDGDGTLWSGDVAEDVYLYAVEHRLIQDALHEPLFRQAQAYGLDTSGTASEIAGTIFRGYLDNRYPELEVCEVMAWCFGGYTMTELRQMAMDALNARKLDARVHRELTPIFEFSRARGIGVALVSASPRFIVELAAERWEIRTTEIAATTLRLDGERALAELAEPVPYAETKVDYGRRLLGSAEWLATFGDSAFDVPMMLAARLGVAVYPKPGLRAVLAEVPGAVVLAP